MAQSTSANNDRTAKTAGKPESGPWHGDAVSSGQRTSETPEASADRAEGNAAIRADQARERQHPDGRERASEGKSAPNDSADSQENSEEKRQAAVEEHAAASRKTSPHGKL